MCHQFIRCAISFHFTAHQKTPKGVRDLNKLLKKMQKTYLKQQISISLSKEEMDYWTDYIKSRLIGTNITQELVRITKKQTEELINHLQSDQGESFLKT